MVSKLIINDDEARNEPDNDDEARNVLISNSAKPTLKGSNLMIVLSDEGGLPIYSRAISIDKSGKIHNNDSDDYSSKND